MRTEHDAVLDAKRSLKAHIQFLEKLLSHLKGPDKTLRGRAICTSWCINNYFQERLMPDIQAVIEKNSPLDNKPDA